MQREVDAGVNFLRRLAVEQGGLDKTKANNFAEKLRQLLCDKYEDHWYPENPNKGQAFRCIRVSEGVPCDDEVLRACEESKIKHTELALPREITLWIDPLEVCARSGENCKYFTVASFKPREEAQEDLKKDKDVDLETSDYHSATSSDCGSAVSSDTEDDGKDAETEGGKEKEEEKIKLDSRPCVITMIPRVRERIYGGSARQKVTKTLIQPRCIQIQPTSIPIQPNPIQYFYHPASVWPSTYKKKGPVFLTSVSASTTPVFSYYVMSQPPPQFIMPHATLQPWGAVKD
ncbi:hypothetical protein UPYG_G00151880 [Umbra pygmaea]|uniref:Anti-proliferative protein domain-containing protein n=1 Tax=Umbra pygmaea TaxID=75934 RepID=A0ABD0XHU0_UMBPY